MNCIRIFTNRHGREPVKAGDPSWIPVKAKAAYTKDKELMK